MKGKIIIEIDFDGDNIQTSNSELLIEENDLGLPECEDCGNKYTNCGDYCMVGIA